jgi:HD-like signal output (HDOD) protein
MTRINASRAAAGFQIPVLPAAHARALAMLEDDDVRIGELARVIETDPALTAALLRAANSASSASRTRIDHPRAAVVRVGLASTKRLVAAAVVGNAFASLGDSGLDVESLWEHCLGIAVMTESVVESARLRSAGFSAGLLHDIGRLMMASAQPQRYMRVVELVRRGVNPLAAEQLVFGENHALVGYRLATAWELGATVSDAILGHHTPEGGGEVTESLYRARQVLRSLNISDGLPKDRKRTATAEEPAPTDAPILFEGGEKALRARIEWYKGALSG